MMLTLVSRGKLWLTKWVGKNRFKGFLTGYWLTYTTLINPLRTKSIFKYGGMRNFVL